MPFCYTYSAFKTNYYPSFFVQPLNTLKLEYIEIPLLLVKVNRVLNNYFAAGYFVSNLKSYAIHK